MKSVIQKGNIVKEVFPGAASLKDPNYVNMYLGSGNFGGLFDAYGFMHRPYRAISEINEYNEKICNTALLHQGHYARGRYGLDYHIPFMRFGFSRELPADPETYQQTLNIYDGYLETKFENQEFQYQTVARFNPEIRDILYLDYEFEDFTQSSNGDLAFFFMDKITACYENVFSGGVKVLKQGDDFIQFRVCAGSASSLVLIRTSGFSGLTIAPESNKIVLAFCGSKEKGTIVIAVADEKNHLEIAREAERISANTEYAEQCNESWHKRWGTSYIDHPDEAIHALWCRSVYYLFCTYSPEPTCPPPPVGWTGNLWNFHFAQDFSYILPALLRLGHLDIAMAKVEFYASRLDVVKRNTKRIYGAEGAMWPWEFPIGEDFDIFTDGSFPNWFQFEIHNAAYPARMAYETGLHAKDMNWIKTVVLPIVLESAVFFKSISAKAENGKWDLFVTPSMGQDELGQPNNKNYLCALYSATYCLKTALDLFALLESEGSTDIEAYQEERERFAEILKDGYHFDKLFNEEYGIYFSSEESNEKGVIGFLKHPVPINPLFALPLEDDSAPLKKAYEMRHELCDQAWPGHICGWTLAAYWVSASHMGKAPDLLSELSRMPGDFMDQDQYQFLESSILHWMQYYTTTHGLFLQAIQDSIVSDFWGVDQIGHAFPLEWKGAKYFNLKTKSGNCYSGVLD